MSRCVTDEEDEDEEFLRLQRRPAELAPRPKSAEVKQRQRRDRFVQVPLRWAEQMTKATETPRAFVGIWLLHLAWKAGKLTFPLTQRSTRGSWGQSQGQARRPAQARGSRTDQGRPPPGQVPAYHFAPSLSYAFWVPVTLAWPVTCTLAWAKYLYPSLGHPV
jgi:hypothetical protein